MADAKSPDVVLVEPAIESLFAQSKESLWPNEIIDDVDITYECRIRHELLRGLNNLFDDMPDAAMDVSIGVDRELVRSESLVELYNNITRFLDSDPNHRRLILYLPFEILPSKDWPRDNDGLRAAADRFMRSYMRCWRELLNEMDVRANFFDGNILEKELAPDGQPRVVKAAHLIPQLLKKELITIDVVKMISAAAANDILKSSIDEALAALSPVEKPGEKFEGYGVARLQKLPDEIAAELLKLDMQAARDHAHGLPPARIAWERKDNEDKLITKYAKFIARLLGMYYPPRYVLEYAEPSYSCTVRLCALRGLGLAGEYRASKDRRWGLKFSEEFFRIFQEKWVDSPEVSDELEGVLARWVSIKIAYESDVIKFGFELPQLDADFSKTGSHAMEIKGYAGVIEKIATSPEYSKLLYPIATFFGSRLKGYAKRNADLDAAVFIRPGTSPKKRGKIRQILAQLFSDKKVGGKVVEFWLEEKDSGLHIRDFPNPDVFLADSTWAHLLMESVWLGEDAALREMYARLLPGFLRLRGKTFNGIDMQRLCLDEMERDVLQYRLMHKGYRRFFPQVGGIDPRAENLDPESVFWDSGYRRLATKLFVSRVFLPQLGKSIDL